jgi:hypothetical protein
MDDAVIDTNVLIVASLAHAGKFGESHRTPDECSQVFEWLDAFRNSTGVILLDNDMEILAEYHKKMTGQDLGLMVIDELMQSRCRLYEIKYEAEHDKAAVVPAAFADLDRSDRKFLAVALADIAAGYNNVIANATDTHDWRKIEAPCKSHGVTVLHLLDE